MTQALEDLKQCAREYAQASNIFQNALAGDNLTGEAIKQLSGHIDTAQQYLIGAAMAYANEIEQEGA